MEVKNKLTGEVREARWTTDHAASSYGQPVLVLEDGQAVDDMWWEEAVDKDAEAKERNEYILNEVIHGIGE